MIRNTGRYRPKFLLLAPSHHVMVSQSRQHLGQQIPVGLADASNSCESLRKLVVGPLEPLGLGLQVLHLSHQGRDARFVVQHTPRTVTGVLQVNPPPAREWGP